MWSSSSTTLGNEDTYEEVHIEFLPPIALDFSFPENYPSEAGPSFKLACAWLDHSNISTLTQKLDAIWLEEGPGVEILYTWMQYLVEHTLSILGVSVQQPLLHIQKSMGLQSEEEEKDSYDCPSIKDLINMIVQYDSHESRYQFTSSFHTCGVCFVEKLGSNSVKFPQCRHIYCSECVSNYFTSQIRDGAVRSLTCPDTECNTEAGPHLVKRLVGDEIYVRYEKFLLQSTLDGMNDVVYCPRNTCQAAVLIDPDVDNLARCANCNFIFCTLCMLTFHGQNPCRGTDEDEKTSLTSNNNQEDAAVDFSFHDYFMNIYESEVYEKGSVKTRNKLERKYGRVKKLLEKSSHLGGQAKSKKMEKICNDMIMDMTCTPCPSCGCQIEKISGCNHVMCAKCKCHFCWGCGKEMDEQHSVPCPVNPRT